MNEREAQAYKKLQTENVELRKQLALLQNSMLDVKTRESPPPTKEQFEKMGYRQRVEFKWQFPEVYQQYIK